MIFSHWLYLRGLLTLESTGDSMIMFHGTTQNGATSIVKGGLRMQSELRPDTNLAGEFWATTSHNYASLSALAGEEEPTMDNPPVVLKFALPSSIFTVLREGDPPKGHYSTLGEGAFEFYAKSFPLLNKAIKESGWFQSVPLTPEAEAKWNEKLNKQIGQTRVNPQSDVPDQGMTRMRAGTPLLRFDQRAKTNPLGGQDVVSKV
jgi:hypothetical protein